MKRNSITISTILALLAVVILNGCQQEEPRTLTVVTHDSFAIGEDVIRQFEQENDVTVNFVLSGDTGSALNKVILTKDAPLGDVFYGVDNTFLSRALDEDIFESYQSPMLADISEEFILDEEYRALPVDYGDVCINYDKAYFNARDIAVPQNLDDLLDPTYAGMLVVENPAVSSPGLAFLLATIAQYGEEGYLDYWQQLYENDVVVVNDWETAYYSNFSASSGLGPQPMVVSYATSPAAEVIFASEPLQESPTASIIGTNACFRQVEFVGILEGTPNRDLAQKFIDYMLSVPFQQDIPMNMFVLPVNVNAQLPAEFEAYIQIPDAPATLPFEQIAASREAWIQAWQETVLQ
ncbi:MAG: Putative ABC transporter substrate binding protein [Anaerolinea thermophila]|uniref:Putative ABC transporter substrate binding protein n=1 Tax=Anaerolinea thermophila TaxID=167964 RepID=A0A117LGT1_9CHLR|nr:MAG: Putative ABC transporter substrate binding protein [Anaerolinea thermophila]